MSGYVAVGLVVILVAFAGAVTMKVMGRASKGYESARARRESGGAGYSCSTCRASLESVGTGEFRAQDSDVIRSIGGVEGLVALEIYRCTVCRKVEFFLPPAAI